jgi:UDP-N-acetylglucosamine--N-acetylmuramyl-(pentapeptide) pyrophosphoryl-undecaprenol N-acetylglucosamine transferase
MKVVFTGGGSGGHVIPLVAVAREIRRIYPQKNLELFYIGPRDPLSLVYLSEEDFHMKSILAGKIRQYFDVRNFIDIVWNMPIGFIQSIFLLMSIKPILVVTKGGTGSIQVTYAAKLLGIPVYVHESDVVPGRSNQKAYKWAKKVFTSFNKTEYFDEKKVSVIGNPIRKEIMEGSRDEAKTLFNLSYAKPVLFFMGGSQGAEALNDFVLDTLQPLLEKYEIIHMTGTNNFKEVTAESDFIAQKELLNFYHPYAFLDEERIKHAYAASDMIIARAGSGSIFEIAAVGKASILVPLPGAGDHQAKNAYQYAQNGASLVVEQDNLAPNFFLENLELIFLNKQKLQAMQQAALAFAKPLAAKALAREILEFLTLD